MNKHTKLNPYFILFTGSANVSSFKAYVSSMRSFAFDVSADFEKWKDSARNNGVGRLFWSASVMKIYK